MVVKIEQLQDGGRLEFIYRDRAGEPEEEGKATHVEGVSGHRTARSSRM
jgi:hypothetical protein